MTDEIIVNKTEAQTQEVKVYEDKLKTIIIEWFALDDCITSLRNAIKDKQNEKKQFEQKLLELMEILKRERIITNKGNIIKNIKSHKGPITPELIKTTLTDILGNKDTAELYTNHIIEKRPTKESTTITKEKVRKQCKKVQNKKEK